MAKKKKEEYKLYILECPNCNGTGFMSWETKLMVTETIPCDFKPCRRGSIEVLANSKKQAEDLCFAIYSKWKHSTNFDPDKNIFKNWLKT